MNYIDHSFDWKGFIFSLKAIAICLTVGVTWHYGFLYTVSYFAPTTYVAQKVSSPSIIVVQAAPSVPAAPAAVFSSATSQRIINSLTVADAIPVEGKFIVADLVNMKLSLYEDGTMAAEYPIITKGRSGTPWETPSGFYDIQTKEETHFSSIGHVYMPWSMQFYGNYFIHGWTYYPDGTPVSATFSGGCIKLSTEDAKSVFAFADVGTKVFVYDSKQTMPPQPLDIDRMLKPELNAAAYLVADIDTGDVYTEQNALKPYPVASVTKLMTGLVANETISFDRKVSVQEGGLFNPQDITNIVLKTFFVGDLFYPLLMQSSNPIAESIAAYYGKSKFLQWMNTTAQALGMTSTVYADASGVSPENVSTAEDLFRLAAYLVNKKSFIFDITRTQNKTIYAEDGSKYQIVNVNAPADATPFDGGKVGHTIAANDTMVSVLSFKVGDDTRRAAVIVLDSNDQAQDTKYLADWIINVARQETSQGACVSCAKHLQYRKIK